MDVQTAQDASSSYVQFGCGLTAPASWRNFDASPTLQLQRLPLVGSAFQSLLTRRGFPVFPPHVEYGDIVRGLPLAPDTCKAIYCSHVLEHLSLEDCRRALQNTYSYLEAGGVFRLVLPDLRHLAESYVRRRDGEAAAAFMEATRLGERRRRRGPAAIMQQVWGNSRHLWMWDYEALSAELEQVGFAAIRRAKMGDAADPHFAAVEEKSRWEGCLGIECRKLH